MQTYPIERIFTRSIDVARREANSVIGYLYRKKADVPAVDEISLLFHDEDLFAQYVEAAKDAGRWMGGTREEQIRQWPPERDDRLDAFGAEMYRTRYEFVQVDDTLRIEAMFVEGGDAPLHDRHFEIYEGPYGWALVHASFKCKTMDHYRGALENLNDGVRLSLRREYVNGYGLFSYWEGFPGLYIKPRVNLRD